MTAKEKARELVEALPERELATAVRVLEGLMALSDPVAGALAHAPDDDEPTTSEDRAAVAEGWEDHRARRGASSEDVRRELRTQ